MTGARPATKGALRTTTGAREEHLVSICAFLPERAVILFRLIKKPIEKNSHTRTIP